MRGQEISLKDFEQLKLATLIGAVAAIVKHGVTWVGKLLGLVTWDMIDVSAAILTYNQVHGWGANVLGWIVLVYFGGMVGVMTYYSLYWLGKDYLFFKSIGIAVTVWFINASVMARPLGLPLSAYQNFYNLFFYFLSALAYGVTVAWMLKKIVFKTEKTADDLT